MASNNIGLPITYFSHDLHQAEKIADKILGYPFIIKVIEGTQGVGVHLVKSKKEAHEMFEAFFASRTQILLQEFIEEFKGKDLRVFVVGDKVVASMMRVAGEGEFRSNLHRGGMGYNVELTAQEKEMAVKAVKILGLNVAGVDILRSKRGPLIIEVNSSPGLEGIEGVTKVKIAEEIIRFAELKHTHEDL
jgi:ribosomal protein S6--L-glutamate ligase